MGFLQLVKPSARVFLEEGKKAGLGRIDRIHGYVYGRWPYFYISFGLGRHPLYKWLGRPILSLFRLLLRLGGHPPLDKQGFAEGYHGKAIPLDAARKLVKVEREISVENLEHVIPFKTARDIILKNPQALAVMDCPCRASRETPCLPLDVCLIVGEPFVSFILEHHPSRSRTITPGEAEAILEAEHKRGHVSHAFFKDAMLGRFYAICNCCSCCCGAMSAHRRGTPMLISSGYVAVSEPSQCTGCGKCVRKCQFSALSLEGESKEDRKVVVDTALCLGCGVCVSACPTQAMRLERDPARPAPLDMDVYLKDAEHDVPPAEASPTIPDGSSSGTHGNVQN